jgi:hypothetical protein
MEEAGAAGFRMDDARQRAKYAKRRSLKPEMSQQALPAAASSVMWHSPACAYSAALPPLKRRFTAMTASGMAENSWGDGTVQNYACECR